MNASTHRRLICWLRPLAVLATTAALAALWSGYVHDPAWSAAMPSYLLHDLRTLYADWMPPDASQVHSAMAHLSIDLWNSPTFDRFALAVLVATVAATATAWAAARRIWTPIALLIAIVSTFLINVTVARIPGGYASFVEPFTRSSLEYFPGVREVGDKPIHFIETYAHLNRAHRIGHHPGTHPPGGILFLWVGHKWFDAPAAPPSLADRFSALMGNPVVRRSDDSLEHAVWFAVGFTALGVLPAWWLARTVGGAAAARRVLPLYVVAPNLVLFGATCMDGVFLVFCLAAMAAGVAAMRRGWSWVWTSLLTLLAGAMLWLASFMTFAAIGVPTVMGCYALCVGIRRPLRGAMMLARCGLVGVAFIGLQLIASHLLKYDLRAVADAAMDRDYNGLHVTGYESFALWRDLSIANAFAFVVGSGVAVCGLALTALIVSLAQTRLRGTGLPSFAPAVLLTIALMATSTLFTLETERVWMFMTPLVLIAATSQFRGRFVWSVVIALSLAQVFWLETQYNVYW